MIQQEQRLPPWAQGPFDLIRHANGHLKLGGDSDRLIALIGFDNAIEICIDVFLNLHPKVRLGVEFKNEEVEKARRNYHTKLEFFYNYAKENKILVEIPIEDVIWYHQLRNQLYHSGSGLVPQENALFGAQAAAYTIFKSLFNLDFPTILNDLERKTTKVNENTLEEWFGEKIRDLKYTGTKPRIEAEMIRKIMRTKGHLLLMQKINEPDMFYRICELPDDGFGFQIILWNKAEKKWRELTSYTPSKVKTLEEARNHLIDRGYVEYKGELPLPIVI